MKFEQYQRVRLMTNKYEGEGFYQGMFGAIVEVYAADSYVVEGYEVDFVGVAFDNPNATISCHTEDLEALDD